MRVPSIFTQKKQTMRRKLFGYMLVLVLILFVVIFIGMLLLGQYSSTKDKISDVLSLQMEVFEREIVAHQDNLAMRNVQLSKDASLIMHSYFTKERITFDDLANSQLHINSLQSSFIDLLSREILQTECSGAFILLNTTVNTSLENADNSKTGIYIQRNSVNLADDTLLLYRGNAKLGKENEIMPHRKWQMEFDSNKFPDYDKITESDSSVALEKTFYVTNIVTLPGTSEKVMLVAIPIRGHDDIIYGICGFEISANTFKMNHSQPSTFEHLVCVFSKKQDENIVDYKTSFTSGITNGYHLAPSGNLSVSPFSKTLSLFSGDEESYVGITRDIQICCGDNADHTLTVMIPKYDYTKIFVKNVIQIVFFILLLLFFAISCCGYFSKRYISPIIRGLDRIKKSELGESESSTYLEIEDLFVYLGEKEKEFSAIQAKVDKLAYSRKNEIDPNDYEYFKMGIKTLTKQERTIFELYLSGKSAPEILEITGIKERTLKFHNGNIYEKLGVHSRKQMLRYAMFYQNENGGII